LSLLELADDVRDDRGRARGDYRLPVQKAIAIAEIARAAGTNPQSQPVDERKGDFCQLSSVSGVSVKSLRFCLRFRLSGEGAANLLHISGVIQIVRHYNPVAFQVETISRFGHKTQSLHLLLPQDGWDRAPTRRL
jgi:hypothetical protein